MRSIFDSKIINILSLVGVAFCFVIVGYLLGIQQVKNENPQSGVLVEIDYSGGFMSPKDQKTAVNNIKIYNSGQVYKETRDRKKHLLRTINLSDMNELRDQIKTANFRDIFSKKDKRFCMSSLDGVDEGYIFYMSNGDNVSFTSCDYVFDWGHPLLMTIGGFRSERRANWWDRLMRVYRSYFPDKDIFLPL